jgi:hypothetical protein
VAEGGRVIERTEHRVLQEITRRLVRVEDATPSLAISACRAHLGLIAASDDEQHNARHWMSVATIAAKQAASAIVRCAGRVTRL